MALTRKALKAMGIEDEKIDSIIDMHTDTVEALKKERDDARADAQALPGVQKELDDLKKTSGGDWQKKYEDEHSAFETYKNDIAAKEARGAKESAYRAFLKSSGVLDKYIDVVIRADASVIDGIKLEDGKITGADALSDSVKKNWGDFIGTTGTRPGGVETPPGNNGGSAVTKESIMAIKDPAARRAAIAQNIELFGKGENS